MQITLVPDSSIASAPAGFTAAVEAAASVFEQDFPGNYNVNISYGWGTFDNTPSAALTTPGSLDFSLGGGISTFVSYSELRDLLTANAVSSAQIKSVASLPASGASFPGGATTFLISFAEEKALGVFSADSGAIDGSIGFNIADASEPGEWEAAAFTEIAHALGWNSIAQGGSVPSVADLFRYASPGQYQWTSGQPAYFSIDGGNTNLADFSTSFDQTLFTDLPAGDSLKIAAHDPRNGLDEFRHRSLERYRLWSGQCRPPAAAPLQCWRKLPQHPLAESRMVSVAIWEMSGATLAGGAVVADPGPSWQTIGTGDFNDDGHADILSSEQRRSGLDLGNERDQCDRRRPSCPNPGPSWSEIGTGDFNEDGHSDILLAEYQRAASRSGEMSGTSLTGGGRSWPDPGPDWQAIGTGDFNGDGHADILWQNTSTGQVSIWEMSGTSLIGGGCRGPILGRDGQRLEPAISTTTAIPTSCCGTSTARHRDLGNERDQRDRRRLRRMANPGLSWSCGRNRRFQRRRPFRHPVAERERPGLDLGNERDQRDRRAESSRPTRGRVGARFDAAI